MSATSGGAQKTSESRREQTNVLETDWAVLLSHEAREIIHHFFRRLGISLIREFVSPKGPWDSPPARWVIGRPPDPQELTILGEKTLFIPQIDIFIHFSAAELFSPTYDLAYTRRGDSDGPLGHIPSAVDHLETSRCLKNGQN